MTLTGHRSYVVPGYVESDAHMNYGARVGSDSVDSIVSSTDSRAVILNQRIESWLTGLSIKARAVDMAFAASWKKWYTDWIAFRAMYAVETDKGPMAGLGKEAVRSEAEDRLKELYIWEARFEQQRAGKDAMTPATEPDASQSQGIPTWVGVGIFGAMVYGIWRFFLRGH
jgi:hypothetical protein